MTNLEKIIRQHVQLSNRPNGKGWLTVLCRVCNDHGKKGKRAGFLFTPISVSYHCFNCAQKGNYSLTQPNPLSDDMVKVLRSFDVSEEEIQQINFEILNNADNKGTGYKPQLSNPLNLDIVEARMPPNCVRVDSLPKDHIWRQIAELYLTESRGIDPSSYPFYIGLKSNEYKELYSKWEKRLIIPCYKDNKLVYFEGRDLTGKQPKKYIGADVPKSNMLYGFDRLYIDKDKPLFITEGFFDALCIGGVAVFGNVLYKEVVHHLNSSPRTKVVIPDRQGNGYKLAQQAIKLGWSISTPDIPSTKDINEAVLKYGKLYVIKSIMDNIYSGFAAETHLRFYCTDSMKKS